MSDTDKALMITTIPLGSILVLTGLWVMLDSGLCVDCKSTGSEKTRAVDKTPKILPAVSLLPQGARFDLRVSL